MRHSNAMGRWRFRLAAGLLAGAAFTQNSWVLGFELDPTVSETRSYASELAVLGRPYDWVFDAADTITGGLVALALIVLVGLVRRQAVVTWLCYAVFAITTIADSLLPLTCSPTTDVACRSAEDDFRVPISHTVHTVTSSIGVLASLAAAVGLVVITRRIAVLGTVTVVVAVVTTVLTGWSLQTILTDSPLLGWAQRAQILTVSLGLFIAVGLLWQASLPRRGPPSTPSDLDAHELSRVAPAGAPPLPHNAVPTPPDLGFPG